ncbi:transcriptional regulator [Mesorhizobium sp. M7A.F.Ca.US.006.04.2.1]|uniref:Helix-turn-helix HxlR type n=1 Tax=Mesorhizobium ciceri biovar biserrulae (strain HAMBI 2942 / LMG 23838 / WSM1271) TaxID=765698 RepID=E8TBX2_MESCW|nr:MULTISPECIES: helix-turn-helix domain-containing protein [Mesorhizobium]ADV12047.1 helix-turn-helix HxlR type [Mesorhizobium ciceri biovar biserrulae WSM1271]RUX73948.1 transcriptional regulator [Mesorhizobium sp. M7A.F.Ca.US.005.03.1.1]RUY22269.1 transcriptional regulator [Mesorhizobium sp. M7A.F.Ca.US.001.04.2.1]RUY37225.1 transcriptional regulator [Mesorhizobium sp. M7A.F.Ca.US.001.04.1.1]RUZ99190.1 transcriptional regulator [Mesorhizobium sp. M7A.F.Ca.US.001.02.1.1]
MATREKSDCPINLSLELIGDRWTLLIIRDMVFAGKKHFREFLQSDEGISSRTLAERLQTLQDEGILTRSDDPTHGLRTVYRLTEAGIDLLPVLATLGAWGSRHRKADERLARITDQLAAGGEAALEKMKAALRTEHSV